MRRAIRLVFLGLVPPLAFAGCAIPKPQSSFVDPGFRGGATSLEVNLAEAPGPRLALDLVGWSPLVVDGGAPWAVASQSITGRESITLAAQASMLGNLLDAKARECCSPPSAADPNLHSRLGNPANQAPSGPLMADLRSDILRVAALEARNQAAGVGLTLFYRLGQVIGQRQSVEDGLGVVDSALRQRDLIVEQGMPVPAELKGLQNQRLDFLTNRSRLDEAITQLSAELRHQLNVATTSDMNPVWPVDLIPVADRAIDYEAEVMLGLSRRPEVLLLHRLDTMQTPESLRGVQSVLSAFNPLLGMACDPPTINPACRLGLLMGISRLEADREARDLSGIRRVYDTYRVERERQIVKEIRMAAVETRTAQDRLHVARDRVDLWMAELKDLEAKANREINTFARATEVRLSLIAARAALWEAATALLIAEAKLHQSQFSLL